MLSAGLNSDPINVSPIDNFGSGDRKSNHGEQIANMAALLSFPLPIRTTRVDFWTLPRGGMTEVLGEASSGRTALSHWMLTNATLGGEIVALVDCDDAFDPASARAAGVDLGKLLWVQCGHMLDTALRATDLILHAGGFGLVVLDLGDASPQMLQRVPSSYWYRFQRTIEHTPSTLVIVARQAVARSSSIRQVVLTRQKIQWKGVRPFQIIDRLELEVFSKKPMSGVPIAVNVEK